MEELPLQTDLCSVVSWQQTLLLLTGSTAPGMDQTAFLLCHQRDSKAARQKTISYSNGHKLPTWRQREKHGLGRGVQDK